MKTNPNPLTRVLLVLVASAMGLSTAWSDLTPNGRRIASHYEKQLKQLKKELEASLPTPNQGRMSAYQAARKAETAAEKALAQAQQRSAKYKQAKSLVDHAKGKWIGGAEKGIAKAKAKLKNAGDPAARQAAQRELAEWEKNKQEGLKALEKRQQALDEAERDRPKAQKALEDAKKELAAARERTVKALDDLGLDKLLASDAFDGRLAKFVLLNGAVPERLAPLVEKGREGEQILDRMLADEDFLIQIAVADGPRGGRLGRAMEIYTTIQEASKEAADGPLQRLALAISLEHAVPHRQRNARAATNAPAHVDPLARYRQYEKAFLAGELDPAFANLTVWDMRHVVNGEEPDEISEWGRAMLRAYRPDHITMGDYRWRYVALVRSDIPYGSQNVKDDKDELQFFQNILMNGGVCGRRAFIGRFMLRAFGIPTTARPQKGHAALAHWTPDGWVICLGAGWGKGWTKTAYRDDRDFLATTQARATGAHYLRVKRAHWIADLMGEKRVWGFGDRAEPGFWNGVALYTQKALIEAADAKTLEAVGEDIAEATETKEKIDIVQVDLTEDDRKIREEDGVIRIPAAATSEPTRSGRGLIFMDSALGGKQLHYSRGSKSPFAYSFQCQVPGRYALVAKVATPSWKLGLLATVNGADEPVPVPLPHSVGLWENTEPVAVELKSGRNTLRFTRDSTGNSKGITLKEFTLIPWERRLELLAEEEAADGSFSIPQAKRVLLDEFLYNKLAELSHSGKLEALPFSLSKAHSKVCLAKVDLESGLTFQAPGGDVEASFQLDELADEDLTILSRLAARLLPGDAQAYAIAGLYLELSGQPQVAKQYYQHAGQDVSDGLREMFFR